MRRLDNGEGSSPYLGIRLPERTHELLAELVAALPPKPFVGQPTRATVLREVIDTGIEAVAIREGIKLGSAPKSTNAKAPRKAAKAPAKPSDPKAVHPNSRARTERRLAARRAAGCTCKGHHIPTCKLYRAPSSTA
jgi:hypothetical protein